MIDLHAELAFLRFQARSGTRVALRTLVPVVVGCVAAAVLYGSPSAVIAPLAALLFPPFAAVETAALATGLVIVVAAAQAPRLRPGATGWVAHLPASANSRRRAATAGLVVSMTPLLALVAAAGLSTVPSAPLPALVRLGGLPILAWAATLASLRVKRRARAAAAAAAVLAFSGSPALLAGGVLLAVLAEAAAGGLRDPAGAHSHWSRPTRAVTRAPQPTLVWLRITTRALGWRLPAASATCLLALIPAYFFLTNNELSTPQTGLAARLAGVAAAVLVIGSAGDSLVRRRPPWPWARSLPWSAAARVSLDALVLAGLALPVLAAIPLLHGPALLEVAAALPYLALRGAASIRQGATRMSGSAGPLAAEGLLWSALVAVLPTAALAMVALLPVAFRWAADSERSLDVSRWHELHHLAAGDPLSWSGT